MTDRHDSRHDAYARAIGERLVRTVAKAIARLHVAVYRTTRGRLGARATGRPTLLLTVTGRRSGRPRTTPLFYVRDADAFVVVASNGGRSRDPDWWRNLKANPSAEVQVERDVIPVRAEQADAAERARLWPALIRMYPPYDSYRRRTTRSIPLVKLRPLRPA